MAQAPSNIRDLEGWWSEQNEIGLLIRKLVGALESREGGPAGPIFGELESVIHDHLRVEEDVIFPMAEKTNPEQTQPIRSLRLAHIVIRQDLTRIGEQIELSHLDAARAMLEAFLDSFGAHERLEDQLITVLKKSTSA
jgi:hemerythrin-like domain-containing protein